jgi:hypothetical protein
VTRVREEYIVRRDNIAMRPPTTYIEQTRIIQRNVNITNNVTVINKAGGGNVVMAQSLRELASRPQAGGGLKLEHVTAQARQQYQERGAELRQFREQRSSQERQASSWQASGSGEGRRLAQASARPRPMSLPASPVSAPIHNHAAGGTTEALHHSDQNTPAQGLSHQLGTHHPALAGQGAGSDRFSSTASPQVHHQSGAMTPMPEHSPLLGQAAPHDVTATPLLRSRAGHGGGSAAGTEQPRLHVPPQYTHRQPPPPPRPAGREHQSGHHNP